MTKVGTKLRRRAIGRIGAGTMFGIPVDGRGRIGRPAAAHTAMIRPAGDDERWPWAFVPDALGRRNGFP